MWRAEASDNETSASADGANRQQRKMRAKSAKEGATARCEDIRWTQAGGDTLNSGEQRGRKSFRGANNGWGRLIIDCRSSLPSSRRGAAAAASQR